MIGKRLKQARKQKGMTQQDLAKTIGVSVGSVKKWEQDIVDPNTATLISIAVALNVSLDYLFGNDAAPDLVMVADGHNLYGNHLIDGELVEARNRLEITPLYKTVAK